jgi:predicted transcriptional regulator
MIQFACKKISRDELFRCSFNLDKTEFNVLKFLLRQKKGISTIEISDNLKLERTTVQKAVTRLIDKKLVSREKQNLPQGGYIYIYKAKDKTRIIQQIKKVVRDWYRAVVKDIERW